MGEENMRSTSEENAEDSSRAELYTQRFWSNAMTNERRMLPQTLFIPLLYTTLLMWACLSLYWGSLTTNDDLGKLKAVIVNLEGHSGLLGNSVVTAISNTEKSLDWRVEEGVVAGLAERLVLNEDVWAALEISETATSALDDALGEGDPTYNPSKAIALYYTSARNQITVNSHVVPAILAIIEPTLGAVAVQHTASFLQNSSNNLTALETAMHCPQCLANPFVLRSVDLVPFDSPVASGSTMVGLIFLLTFTFTIFQTLRTSAQTMGAKLCLSSTLIFRTTASLGAYLLMALMYTLINRAFGVPMSGRFAEAPGFMAYWMLNWCTMAAVGLPMESLFTSIGMKWAGYFLSFWIIVNVSGGFSSFDVMPTFYRYGYATPFYHSIQGARTIIFGTKSHLGQNFGVLIAWSIVSLAGLYVFTASRVRQNKRNGTHVLP